MELDLTKRLKGSDYNYLYVEECASTNTLANELVSGMAGALVADGLVVITDRQTLGRGQHGNRWFSEEGMNLTFSIIRYPKFLDAKDNFYLNVVASLAVHKAATLLGIRDLKVKWPNDLYHFDKKVCGILTECQLSGSTSNSAVIGIGVNVNQKDFTLPSASSLSLGLGHEVCRGDLLIDILRCFDALYSKLKQGHKKPLHEEYLSHQYQPGVVLQTC